MRRRLAKLRKILPGVLRPTLFLGLLAGVINGLLFGIYYGPVHGLIGGLALLLTFPAIGFIFGLIVALR